MSGAQPRGLKHSVTPMEPLGINAKGNGMCGPGPSTGGRQTLKHRAWQVQPLPGRAQRGPVDSRGDVQPGVSEGGGGRAGAGGRALALLGEEPASDSTDHQACPSLSYSESQEMTPGWQVWELTVEWT